nr:hypothetical protein Iba_chr14eCG9580 [Ipomoea batatas]
MRGRRREGGSKAYIIDSTRRNNLSTKSRVSLEARVGKAKELTSGWNCALQVIVSNAELRQESNLKETPGGDPRNGWLQGQDPLSEELQLFNPSSPPANRFAEKSKILIFLEVLQMWGSRAPENELLLTLSTTRFGNSPKPVRSPVNKLLEMLRVWSDSNSSPLLSALTTAPLKELWLKSRTLSCFNLERSKGNSPPRWLCERSRTCNLSKFCRETETGPCKPFLDKFNFTTLLAGEVELSSSQPTPSHLQQLEGSDHVDRMEPPVKLPANFFKA